MLKTNEFDDQIISKKNIAIGVDLWQYSITALWADEIEL